MRRRGATVALALLPHVCPLSAVADGGFLFSGGGLTVGNGLENVLQLILSADKMIVYI